MTSQTSRIQKIDVGTPSPEYLSRCPKIEREVVDVCFHGFQDIPSARGHYVDSPKFACFGHRWCLRLYPGGNSKSDAGNVALYICNMSNNSFEVQFGCSVKNEFCKEMTEQVTKRVYTFLPILTADAEDGSGSTKGWKNFAKRSDIISYLVEGSLIIEVRMRQSDATGSPLVPFIAENPLSKTILGKFNDEGSADVVLEVGGGGEPTAESKRAKVSPATFHAHRFILEDCAPALAAPLKSGEGLTTISIPDVKPEIFRHLLYYAYGGKVAEDDLKNYAKDIIDAADKYEIVGLKLEAEAILVASKAVTIDNVMELILFADQKNCALLKEAAMDFIVKNKARVVKEVSFDNFPGHLTKDVLMAVDMDESMRVSTLRKRLHDKGLDIDGSREALIARLEESS